MPNADNPYGVSTYNASATNPATSTGIPLPQLIADMQALGLTWLRYQVSQSAIDSPQGTYTWTSLDAAVSAANTAGINIIFGFDQPPAWGIDGTTGLPTPAYTTTIATLVAARYNGASGHGHLDAIEIWNEEFDFSSYNNTTYAAVANAGYTAIRGAGFTGKIGCAAMLGISSTAHVTTWVNQLYTSSISSLFDYLQLHYYNGFYDPSLMSNWISFPAAVQAIQAALIANGDPNKPLWVTEFGYSNATVSQANQSQYYAYIFNQARLLSQQTGGGPIAKIMFYTMDSGSTNTDPSSITGGLTPSETYNTAYTTIGQWIAACPTWPGPARFSRFMS